MIRYYILYMILYIKYDISYIYVCDTYNII